MASIGGDILEIRFQHPTLGSGVFYPKSNEGNTKDLGGIRAGDDVNMVSGDGQAIWQLNRQRGSWEIVCAYDMNTREDVKKASQLAGDPVDATWTVSHINGTIWACTGRPVGDIQPDTNAATVTIKVAGTEWTKIQ